MCGDSCQNHQYCWHHLVTFIWLLQVSELASFPADKKDLSACNGDANFPRAACHVLPWRKGKRKGHGWLGRAEASVTYTCLQLVSLQVLVKAIRSPIYAKRVRLRVKEDVHVLSTPGHSHRVEGLLVRQ